MDQKSDRDSYCRLACPQRIGFAGAYPTSLLLPAHTQKSARLWMEPLVLIAIHSCLLTAFMLTGAATTFASQSARDSEALGSHRANLRQWLQRAELANDLEVEKLR